MQCPACPYDIEVKKLKVKICPNCGAKIKFKYRFWYTYFMFFGPIFMTPAFIKFGLTGMLIFCLMFMLFFWYTDSKRLFITNIKLPWDGRQFFLSDLLKVMLVAGLILGLACNTDNLDTEFKKHPIIGRILLFGIAGIYLWIFRALDAQSEKKKSNNAGS